MRYKQTIAKFISVVLLLVFTQRIAGSLYFHNWLHNSKNAAFVTHDGKAVSQYTCSCIDDFNVPFTEPVKFSVQVPVSLLAGYFATPTQELPAFNKYFSSLRAPPAA